jgi:uncharacterized membrane protein
MNENIVTAIFDVESEAYKSFTELRQCPAGPDFTVAEAALVTRDEKGVSLADSFDAAGVGSDDTAGGMLVGTIVGILGGPIGMLLGMGIGALAGSAVDASDTEKSLSMLAATAAKLNPGETAIIALVQEEEPAFDKVFEGYDATVIRHYAADVLQEVDQARELSAELANEAYQKMRSDKKAETQQKVEEHKAEVHERFEKAKATAGSALDEMGSELEGAAKAVKDKATGAAE